MLKVFKMDWKYGWHAVRGTLLAALLISVAVGILTGAMGNAPVVRENAIGFFGEGTMDNVFAFSFICWFAVMAALLVQTVIVIVHNLNGSMFGKEAYLTHTLPVRSWELLGGKALGTWVFGVFMLVMAFVNFFLLLFSAAVGTGTLLQLLKEIVAALPKLGEYHFSQLAEGTWYLLYGLGASLLGSLLLIVLLQFIFIAARQFGKHYIAGGVIVYVVLLLVGSKLNSATSSGFLVVLAMSIVCFLAGNWLLNHRLHL